MSASRLAQSRRQWLHLVPPFGSSPWFSSSSPLPSSSLPLQPARQASSLSNKPQSQPPDQDETSDYIFFSPFDPVGEPSKSGGDDEFILPQPDGQKQRPSLPSAHYSDPSFRPQDNWREKQRHRPQPQQDHQASQAPAPARLQQHDRRRQNHLDRTRNLSTGYAPRSQDSKHPRIGIPIPSSLAPRAPPYDSIDPPGAAGKSTLQGSCPSLASPLSSSKSILRDSVGTPEGTPGFLGAPPSEASSGPPSSGQLAQPSQYPPAPADYNEAVGAFEYMGRYIPPMTLGEPEDGEEETPKVYSPEEYYQRYPWMKGVDGNLSGAARLDAEIHAFANYIRPTETEAAAKQAVYDRFLEIVQPAYEDVYTRQQAQVKAGPEQRCSDYQLARPSVQLTGSTTTGSALFSSDVDITVVLPDPPEHIIKRVFKPEPGQSVDRGTGDETGTFTPNVNSQQSSSLTPQDPLSATASSAPPPPPSSPSQHNLNLSISSSTAPFSPLAFPFVRQTEDELPPLFVPFANQAIQPPPFTNPFGPRIPTTLTQWRSPWIRSLFLALQKSEDFILCVLIPSRRFPQISALHRDSGISVQISFTHPFLKNKSRHDTTGNVKTLEGDCDVLGATASVPEQPEAGSRGKASHDSFSLPEQDPSNIVLSSSSSKPFYPAPSSASEPLPSSSYAVQHYLARFPALFPTYAVIKTALDIRGMTDVYRKGIPAYGVFMMVVASCIRGGSGQDNLAPEASAATSGAATDKIKSKRVTNDFSASVSSISPSPPSEGELPALTPSQILLRFLSLYGSLDTRLWGISIRPPLFFRKLNRFDLEAAELAQKAEDARKGLKEAAREGEQQENQVDRSAGGGSSEEATIATKSDTVSHSENEGKAGTANNTITRPENFLTPSLSAPTISPTTSLRICNPVYPYKLALIDPANPRNDLGYRTLAIKHLQRTVFVLDRVLRAKIDSQAEPFGRPFLDQLIGPTEGLYRVRRRKVADWYSHVSGNKK